MVTESARSAFRLVHRKERALVPLLFAPCCLSDFRSTRSYQSIYFRIYIDVGIRLPFILIR